MHGIVLQSAPLQNLKQSIKSSPFTMKKLDFTPETIIPPSHQSEFVLKIADITLQNPGKLYWHFFGEQLPEKSPTHYQPSPSLVKETFRTTAQELSRSETITKIIEGSLDVVICPSIGMCELWSRLIPKSIYWNPSEQTHPLPHHAMGVEHKTIILTPVQFPLFIIEHGHNYPALSIAVIDVSDNRWQHMQRAPYVDMREVIIPALQTLYTGNVTLYVYDTYINNTVENIFQLNSSQIHRNQNIIEPYITQHTKETRYLDTMFSQESFYTMLKTVHQGGVIHIITSRKGVASSVSCSNCAYIAKCPECNHVQSLVTRRKSGERTFICHACHTKSPVYDYCPECQGLLTPLGYTTQTIAEALTSLSNFSETPIVVIDSDTVKNFKKLTKQYNQVKLGGIIVTTPAFHAYLDRPALSVIVSLEGLLSVPLYDQDTTVYRLLRSVSGNLIIQTKSEAVDPVFLSNTNSWNTYEKNLATSYGTPPVLHNITLTKTIPSSDITRESTWIQSLIRQYSYLNHITTRTIPQKRNTVLIHHALSYLPSYHTEFIKNILPQLTGYSIRKK